MSGISSSTSFYFAYGSNMHLHQMAARCQTSLFMGIGILSGWRWQINERGVANIVKSPDYYVEGVVYDIDKSNKRQLDRNEGVSKGFYSAEKLQIQFISHSQYKARKSGYVARILEDVTTPRTDAIQCCSQDSAGLSPTPFPDNQLQQQNGLPSQCPASEKAVPAAAACVAFEDSKIDLSETVNALVYVSTEYITDGDIRAEYIERMEKAITDGYKLGLSAHFLRQVSLRIYGKQPPSYSAYSKRDRSIPSQQEAARV